MDFIDFLSWNSDVLRSRTLETMTISVFLFWKIGPNRYFNGLSVSVLHERRFLWATTKVQKGALVKSLSLLKK
jgi:hypothetical protein